MELALKKDDIIKFMTRDPQLHVMEILGIEDINPGGLKRKNIQAE